MEAISPCVSQKPTRGRYNLGMTQEAHELLQKALALPENERAELAGNLISSLDATVDQDVDAAWQQEAAVRLKITRCPQLSRWVLSRRLALAI